MDPLVFEDHVVSDGRQMQLEIGMKVTSTRLDLYRSLYWANQGLLHAVRSLREAESATLSAQPSELLKFDLRRTQAMIEETRTLMNEILGVWVRDDFRSVR